MEEFERFSVSRDDLELLKSSYEAVLSPEVASYLRRGDGDLVRAKKTARGRLDCVLIVRVRGEVRKNSVVVDPILAPDSVHLARFERSRLAPLSSVRVTLAEPHTPERFAAVTKRLEELSLSGEGIPLCEFGPRLKISDDITFDRVNLEPSDEGLWGPDTDLILEFDASNSDVVKAAKFAINIVGLKSPSKAVSESMETFALKETTLKFAAFVAREEVDDDLCLSTALFLHSDTISGRRFCECFADGGDSGRLMFCIFSRHVPRGRKAFTLNAGDSSTVRLRLLKEGIAESVATAQTATVQFQISPAYDKLNTAQLDGGLKRYFSAPKYVFCGSRIDIPIDNFLREPSFDDIGTAVPIVIKAVNNRTDCGSRVGAYISTAATTLSEVKAAPSRLPKRTLTDAMGVVPTPLATLPTPLIDMAAEIEQMLSACKCPILVSGSNGSGKVDVFKHLAASRGLGLQQFECGAMVGDGSAATEGRIKQKVTRQSAPAMLLLRNVDRLGRNREGKADRRVMDFLGSVIGDLRRDCECVVIGDCVDETACDSDIISIFDGGHFKILDSLNGVAARKVVMDWQTRKLGLKFCSDVDLERLGQQTAGFSFSDFECLLRKAYGSALARFDIRRLRGHPKVDSKGADEALKEMQSLLADSIGAPKIPDVKWEDIGGLEEAKQEILDTIQLPLRHPQLLSSGLKRSGVLLYGPPGVGKTLLAKAVATECSLNFLSVKGPELLNMYVGQSEENVREVFSRAKKASPCVVFFDELDSLAPNRGKSGDSGGVMDRIVAQLLAELDGMNGGSGGTACTVFAIGATNRPDLLDPALLRPGRFDRLVYVGVADGVEERRKVLSSLTRKFAFTPGFGVEDILPLLPSDVELTGADLYAICSEASLNAVSRAIRAAEDGDIDPSSHTLTVRREDFIDAVDQFVPSVSEEELRHYKSIKKTVFNQGKGGAKTSSDKSIVTDGSDVPAAAVPAQSPGRDRCAGGLLSTALLPPLHLYKDVRREND